MSQLVGLGIATSLGAITLAMRAHHNDPNNEEEPSVAERRVLTVSVVETARRFTGSTDVAIHVRDKVLAMSGKEWWEHEFVLHPEVFQFLHNCL